MKMPQTMAWKLLGYVGLFALLCLPFFCCLAPTLEVPLAPYTGTVAQSFRGMIQWHIKPIKPHHHGLVVCSAETNDQGNFVYKRTFTVPCGDGVLVFSVGPAASYEPFAYDLYDDAYVYSNNEGLCVLYPSYKGIQTSDTIMWTPDDPTSLVLDLGDLPTKISSRPIKKPDTKDETKRGGDFVIMRGGNFYNPAYYQHLKNAINSWPADVDDIEARISELVAALDERK